MILIYNIIQTVISILEIRLCIRMMEKFAEPRFEGNRQKLIVWIVSLGTGGLYGVNRWIAGYYSWLMILTVLGVLALAAIGMFRQYRGIAVFSAANFLFVGGMIDLILMSVAETVMQRPGMFIYLEDNNSLYRIMVMCMSKSILYIFCRILCERIKSDIIFYMKGWKIRVFCFAFCILEYVSVRLFVEPLNVGLNFMVNGTYLSGLVIYFMLILLLICFFGIVILYTEKKNQIRIQDMFLENLKYDYQKMLQLYQAKEAIYHDFRNHLLILGSYVREGKPEGLYAYLDQISRPFLDRDEKFQTGHPGMDMIMNSKLREAREQGIRVKVETEGKIDFELHMTDVELCALIGNIWDNAGEACMKLSKEERWIDVYLKIRQEMILFEMVNPYKDIRMDKEGELLTTKKEGVHGIGMRNIRMITDRHQGYLNYYTEDGRFKLELMIYNE